LNGNWGRQERYDGSLFRHDYSFGGSLSRANHDDRLSFWRGWTDYPPHFDYTTRLTYSWGRDQLHRGGHVSYAWGHRGSADYTRYAASCSWAFKEDFYGNMQFERRISDYWDPQTDDEDLHRLTMRLNYDIDPERGYGMAVRTGSNGTNAFITYRQAVRQGEDLFIILGDPNTDHTQPRIGVKTKWVKRY
jgi:hypothetical protein